MNSETQEAQDVRAVLDKINTVWLTEELDRIPDTLAPLFDEQARIVGSGFAPTAEGKASCVASYVDFKKQAQIHSCDFTEPEVHVAGDTAVATNSWTIVYTMDGTRYAETGNDVYVFSRVSDAWRAVWRAMLPS